MIHNTPDRYKNQISGNPIENYKAFKEKQKAKFLDLKAVEIAVEDIVKKVIDKLTIELN